MCLTEYPRNLTERQWRIIRPLLARRTSRRGRPRLDRRLVINVIPTAAIIDSQTVRTTESGGEHGYDAGKKITGRKRHIAVDTLGLILAICVHRADRQDQDGACFVLTLLWASFRNLKVIFGDSA